MPETTQFSGMDGEAAHGEGALKANTVLLARYKIMGVLGGGGMGTVYQARDLNFPDVKKLVAIKEMQNASTDMALRASTLKNFRREANILATLAHPAIPKIFDFFDQNDQVYLVMEYINGSDLEALLSKTKELPIEKIIEWAIDLCDVLHYLHSHEPEPIVFRDMKPSNVMIDSLGKVRLIDFGIAKNFVRGVKGTMIGTEGYSAPEQYKGDVSPRSDIYSLGATLHHILTRKDPRLEPPFSFNERPIKEFNPQAPPGLITAVEKALGFEAANRYESCREMKTELERLLYRSISIGSAGTPGAAVGTATNASGDRATSFFDDVAQTGIIEPVWKFKTEDEIRCSPTSFRDLAFIGSYDTNVWALKLDTGEFVWKYPTNGGIASSPVVDEDNGLVLFGSEDYSFHAVDYRSGRINWSYTTKDRIRGTPCLAHGYVFFGSDDGCIYALKVVNGREQWQYPTGGAVRSRPYVTNELIIVGSDLGEVVALELSGDRKWSYRTKRGVWASPLVDMTEGICYVGSLDHYMYALDVNSGYNSWRFRTNGQIYSSAVLHEGLLYFGSADGTLYAVDPQTSREKWKFHTEKPIVATPVVHNGCIYFGGTNEYFYCVDSKNGKERWKFKTEGAITATAHIVEKLILVGSMDKTLYALPLVG